MYRSIKDFLSNKIFSAGTKRLSDDMALQLKINNAFSRAAVSSSTRQLDPTNPLSWQFSGFSQNGEDGILDFLISRLKNPNRYFIEIGSNNGIENNTAYLAHVKKFSGLQIEGDDGVYREALKTKAWLVDCFNCFVKESTIDEILQRCLFRDADVFSIDIDGMDYYITRLLFERGLRPRIVVVEYNSAFGPDAKITLQYQEDFNMFKTSYKYLYYGVSLNGWRQYFEKMGYRFVTVESNGVNAFFIDPVQFDDGFVSQLKGLTFAENIHQYRLFKGDWKSQFDRIKDQLFFEIS